MSYYGPVINFLLDEDLTNPNLRFSRAALYTYISRQLGYEGPWMYTGNLTQSISEPYYIYPRITSEHKNIYVPFMIPVKDTAIRILLAYGEDFNNQPILRRAKQV